MADQSWTPIIYTSQLHEGKIKCPSCGQPIYFADGDGTFKCDDACGQEGLLGVEWLANKKREQETD